MISTCQMGLFVVVAVLFVVVAVLFVVVAGIVCGCSWYCLWL